MPAHRRPHAARKRRILAIDIGGSHIKAAVLDPAGTEISEHVRVVTPHPALPSAVLRAIAALVKPLRPYDRISAGFPGVVRDGTIHTAPNLGTNEWRGFELAAGLEKKLGKPARVLNDADVQGLGIIDGEGLECVLTLGTGVGSSLFRDGRLLPHLELGQHPFRTNTTYDQYVGAAALQQKGRKHWNRRLAKVIEVVHTLVNYDRLHLGGGNAAKIDFTLPDNVRVGSNEAGIIGGSKLWSPALDEYFRVTRRRP